MGDDKSSPKLRMLARQRPIADTSCMNEAYLSWNLADPRNIVPSAFERHLPSGWRFSGYRDDDGTCTWVKALLDELELRLTVSPGFERAGHPVFLTRIFLYSWAVQRAQNELGLCRCWDPDGKYSKSTAAEAAPLALIYVEWMVWNDGRDERIRNHCFDYPSLRELSGWRKDLDFGLNYFSSVSDSLTAADFLCKVHPFQKRVPGEGPGTYGRPERSAALLYLQAGRRDLAQVSLEKYFRGEVWDVTREVFATSMDVVRCEYDCWLRRYPDITPAPSVLLTVNRAVSDGTHS